MTECPSCAMEIEIDEGKCPICGYEFPGSASGKSRYIGAVLLILFLAIMFRFYC